MITKEQVMPLLLDACPSFASRWQQYGARWGKEERLLYVEMGELAHHLVDLLQQGRTDELPAVFGACERLHREGDAEVQKAATIGLLEAIQNVAVNSGEDPEAFRRFLGTESLRWWGALNRFWAGESSTVSAEADHEP